MAFPRPQILKFCVSIMPPDPPRLGRLRSYIFSSPRAYTFKISRYAHVKRAQLSIACEQAFHLGDIVKSTRASGTRGETRQLRSSAKWRACSQVMLSSINNDAAIWCLGTSQILVIALLASFFFTYFFR